MSGPQPAEEGTALRQRAEQTLRERPLAPDSLARTDLQELVHELQVHQIELEMQNEELERALAELEDARDRYSDLYDFAPVGYLTLDDKNIIREANLTAATMLGVERSHLIHTPLSHFIFREDQDTYYLHRRVLFETLAPQTWEVRLVKADGSSFYASLAVIVAQGAGGGLVARVSLSDVTARQHAEAALRESEQRYRTVADYTYDWEYWRATDGRILYVSPSSERISGYRPEEFRMNPDLLEMIVHPDDRTLLAQHRSLVSQGKSGADVHEVEFRILRRDGEERWIAHACQQIHDSGGTSLGVRATNRDVTERKQAEAHFQQQFVELQRWYHVTLERESRVLELKHEVNELAHRLGEPIRYPSAAS